MRVRCTSIFQLIQHCIIRFSNLFIKGMSNRGQVDRLQFPAASGPACPFQSANIWWSSDSCQTVLDTLGFGKRHRLGQCICVFSCIPHSCWWSIPMPLRMLVHSFNFSTQEAGAGVQVSQLSETLSWKRTEESTAVNISLMNYIGWNSFVCRLFTKWLWRNW